MILSNGFMMVPHSCTNTWPRIKKTLAMFGRNTSTLPLTMVNSTETTSLLIQWLNNYYSQSLAHSGECPKQIVASGLWLLLSWLYSINQQLVTTHV